MTNTRQSICAAEAIAFAASRTPGACAYLLGDKSFDYATVALWLAQMIDALNESEAVRARLVGVAHSNPVLHLLMLFALEALGIATLPFVQPADGGIETALAYCDLMIAEAALEQLRVPTILVTVQWLDSVRMRSARAIKVNAIAERAPVNVFTTSGSSGAAKGIVFDSVALDARIRGRLWQYGLDRNAKIVAGMQVSTSSTYFIAQAALRVGATLVFPDIRAPLHNMHTWTHAIILPIHLGRLAESAIGVEPARDLKIFVVGARLPDQVRALAQARLGATTIEAYGTTETGWLALMDAQHIGDVLPEVDVEVVDENDQPVPQGSVGEVRGRSPEMCHRYLDGELSARQFRDGWYYTGDLGRLVARGRLELLGRADAMLNFGGMKLSAEVIEEMLSHHGLAAELAAASRKDSKGIEQLVIFLKAPKFDANGLIERVTGLFGANLGPIELRITDQLPRSASGKLQRAELQSLADRKVD